MIRTFLFILIFTLGLTVSAQPLHLIPQPDSVERAEGTFVFGPQLTVAVDTYPGDSIASVLNRFTDRFSRVTGVTVKTVAKRCAQLRLRLDSSLAPEAYTLRVSSRRIDIRASRPAGFFYALQTLQQLLPSRAVLAGVDHPVERQSWTLPAVYISDAPRFGWRGFMLDEGRHFFGVEAVKQVLDVMAAYKMNRFHWHLTEDQGWRIEIKRYPRLTEVGAWRNSKVLAWGEVQPDGQRYGGYYTQAEAREIVNYARERFIEIVPEVDIPGHSQAAVAAYPELLACDPDSTHQVWLSQGISDDVINVANPAAIQFAKDVVDELTNVFPFGYIHLGGDECPTDKWQRNAQCQARLQKIGSTRWRDLQTDFYRQIEAHLATLPASRQRRLIFWNEVLHGNTDMLGSDITIMAWVGADAAARQAASRGLQVILSPQIPYYINRRQSPLPTEPRSQGSGTETVEAVYAYQPAREVPDSLAQRYMGVQANFWSEWVEDASTLQYLMLPRLAAVAEAGWTPQVQRNFPSFVERLQTEPAYYQFKGLNYGRHLFVR